MAITGKKISELDAASVNAFNAILDKPFDKIVWFGTSVPASGYPVTVGTKINATVTNKSIGGSFIFSGINELETQYGFSSDYLIDEIPAGMLQYTFRTILDNGGSSLWDADLFVFDHGHNDHGWMNAYKVNGVLTLTEGNTFDRGWMVGGLNHVIAEILLVNPLARFCIVNEYRYEAFDNKEANKLVAGYWGIPILNWGDDMGVRSLNPDGRLAGTVLDYYTGTGLPGGADNIHPTAGLRAIMVQRLVAWLRSIS